MKQLMPITPGGAGLQFIRLPELPELVTAQQTARYFEVSPKEVGQAIKRNFYLFEMWARRATDQETAALKSHGVTSERETRRANPMLITLEGVLLLATIIQNPQATHTLLKWAAATNRIRQQQSLLIQEQIEGGATLAQIAETIDKPNKPRRPRPKMGRYEETLFIEQNLATLMEETGFNLTTARGVMMTYAALHIDEVIGHIKYAADHIDDMIAEYKQSRH